jgi:hypothetical protein
MGRALRRLTFGSAGLAPRSDRGSTLIFVLGILALLSLFAITFASITRLERTASANYMDESRADVVARAGLNAGIAGLRACYETPGFNASLPVTGSYSQTGPTVPPANGGGYSNPQDPWFFRGTNAVTAKTGNGVPLKLAVNASTSGLLSFSTPLTGSDPVYNAAPPYGYGLASLPQVTPFISGSVGGTYVTNGDVYSLKVLDCQGMLDANSNDLGLAVPDLKSGSGTVPLLQAFGDAVLTEEQAMASDLAGTFANTSTMPVLNTLLPVAPLPNGSGTQSNANYENPFAKTTTAGTSGVTAFLAFKNALPGSRFHHKKELNEAFVSLSFAIGTNSNAGSESQDRMQRRGDDWYTLFKDYMTCWGESDPNVVQGKQDVTLPANAFEKKTAAQVSGPRNPVNLNTAPKPVLLAVLLSVSATLIDPAQVVDYGWDSTTNKSLQGEDNNPNEKVNITRNSGDTFNSWPIAPYKHGAVQKKTIATATDVPKIADLIINNRPYRSWGDVYHIFDLNFQGKIPGSTPLPQDELAAVLGALCPCYLPLGWNPDRSLFYWGDDDQNPDTDSPLKVCADKAGCYAIAEGCFNSGVFEIESLGCVYAGGSTSPYIAGQAYRRVVVRIGGTTWIRGENDLSTNLSQAMGAPSPAGQPNSKLGGWVQAQPIPTSTGYKSSNTWPGAAPLDGTTPGKVVADGWLQERDYGVTAGNHTDNHTTCASDWQNYFSRQPAGFGAPVNDSGTTATTDQGHVEMWVKMPQDLSGNLAGTNECLFERTRSYDPGMRHAEPGQQQASKNRATTEQQINNDAAHNNSLDTSQGGHNTGSDTNIANANTTAQDSGSGDNTLASDDGSGGNPTGVTDIGVGVRLERYGNKLYACRFFFGFSDGAAPGHDSGATEDGGTTSNTSNGDGGSSITNYKDPCVDPYWNTHPNPTDAFSQIHQQLWSDALDTTLGWRPGTWHHIYLSWSASSMTMNLYLDGVANGNEVGGGLTDYSGNAWNGSAYAWQNSTPGFYPQNLTGQQEADAQSAYNSAKHDANEMQHKLQHAPGGYPTQPGGNPLWTPPDAPDGQGSPILTTTSGSDYITYYDNWNNDQQTMNQTAVSTQTWAGDVNSANVPTFSANIGLMKMMLRTYWTTVPAGTTDLYRWEALGYHLVGFGGKDYTSITSLGTQNTPFKLQSTLYDRWCNGTFDGLREDEANPTPPTDFKSVARFAPPSGGATVTVPINFTTAPTWKPCAWGFFPMLAYVTDPSDSTNKLPCKVEAGDESSTPQLSGPDRFGGGRSFWSVASGVRTYSPPSGGNATFNATIKFKPQSNAYSTVTPWALAGVWVTYEVPTQVLEGGLGVEAP